MGTDTLIKDIYDLLENKKVTDSEKMTPSTLLKFMYGHIIEEMLLFLVKASGHKVTDEQKRCEVAGVIGHMDGRIDGTLMDVKSTSSYSFKKFKDGSLVDNDSFGYIDQLKAYAKSEGDTKIAWLAMDKQNGHLTWLEYDLETENSKSKKGFGIGYCTRLVLRFRRGWEVRKSKAFYGMLLLSIQKNLLARIKNILVLQWSKAFNKSSERT